MVNTLARAVSAHPYIAGDHFSAADVYVGSQIGYGLQFGTLPDRAELRDYFARLENRPASLRAAEMVDALSKRPV